MTCFTTNVRQVESLTPAMWLISSGTNRNAWFDSFLILRSRDVALGCLHIMFKKKRAFFSAQKHRVNGYLPTVTVILFRIFKNTLWAFFVYSRWNSDIIPVACNFYTECFQHFSHKFLFFSCRQKVQQCTAYCQKQPYILSVYSSSMYICRHELLVSVGHRWR